jgi:hypothetical protein
MPDYANAYPRKHFFFEMFTRDISLEDCVLDLIDNSIDGLIRSKKIDISATLLKKHGTLPPHERKLLPQIKVWYSLAEFGIQDDCGGIDSDHAATEVFNFGHEAGHSGGALGVYGIGLKRAIFKIGNHFTMDSKTTENGFSINLNVKKWSEKDDKLEDWKIPITFTAKAKPSEKTGTLIKITELRPEVKMRINDGVLENKLHTIISQTYGLFIGRYVEISLNGQTIEPFVIPIGTSDDVQVGRDEFVEGEVKVQLFASIAARGTNGEWASDRAGWYALCNGRIVVVADKTEITGWGVGGSPQFHMGKFRGFIGVAYFQSKNALALPWTTTKRGLNRESNVYQVARSRMKGAAKTVLSFLDSMYKEESPEEPSARRIADDVKPISLAEVSVQKAKPFTINISASSLPSTSTRVQFDALKIHIERIKKHIKKSSWSATKVGKYTFDYYLKTECPE